jgi:hypothetical protein
MNVVVTYPDGTTNNPGTQMGVGTDSGFVDSWTISPTAPLGIAKIQVTAVNADGVTAGIGEFTIGAAGPPCTDSHLTFFTGFHSSRPGQPTYVKKTCDAGLTGSAVFSINVAVPGVSISWPAGLPPTVISFPASRNITVLCNGPAALLPPFEGGNIVTLHEVAHPAGAAPAGDSSITIDFNQPGDTVATDTIHNAKAAVAATSDPVSSPKRTAARLAGTGRGQQVHFVALYPGALLVLAGALIVLRNGRVRRITVRRKL